mgnify:CR=1 FL=1
MAMTQSIKPLKLLNCIDPRLDCMEYVQKQDKWCIFKGAEGQNQVIQQANSYSTAGITFNFNTSSENVIISRNIYAKVQFRMTFTGTSPIGQPILNNEVDSPRAFPLASITNSLKVGINGQSVETNYNDALLALLRYDLSEDCKNLDLSGTPSCLDKYQRYSDGVGSVRNPLSTYENNSYEIGRGAFQLDSITNPVSVDGTTPTTSVIDFTVVEPLLISPMLYKSSHLERGLIGVKNMSVQFNFSAGLINRVWSHAVNAGVNINSAVCSIGAGSTAPPQLLINYLTPPLIDMGEIPKSINYPYFKCETYVNDMNDTLAPNATRSFTNNAIQLSTVPKALYIYASRPNSTKTFETADTFFRINSLSLNYLNVSGQFSSMTINDLYNMSVKNGCDLSWCEWSGKTNQIGTGVSKGLVGSVLKIDIGDLHIPSNVASGMNTNSQLSYTIGLENVNQVDTLGVQISTILVYEGLMTIENGNMNTQIGIINSNDVLQTRANGEWENAKESENLYGGSLFGKVKHFMSMGKKALDVACDLKGKLGGDLVNSGRGGAVVSRSALKKRMFE